MMQIDNIGKGG